MATTESATPTDNLQALSIQHTLSDLHAVLSELLSHLEPRAMRGAIAACHAFYSAANDAVRVRASRLDVSRLLELAPGSPLERLHIAEEVQDWRGFGSQSSWAFPELPPFDGGSHPQKWAFAEADSSGSALLWSLHAQLLLARTRKLSWDLIGQSPLHVRWDEGGSAIHRFPVPLRPTRLAVRMRTDVERDLMGRLEGPSFVMFSGNCYLEVRLRQHGDICAYDRYARENTGDAESAKRFPPKPLHEPWQKEEWYQVVLRFDWAAGNALIHVQVDRPTEAIDAGDVDASPVVQKLELPLEPLNGLCCNWRSGGKGTARWVDLSMLV